MGAPANLVLALDIGGTKLTAGIGDTSGHLRGQRTESTDPQRGATDVLRRAIDLARSVLQDERLAEHNVSVLGVSTMGLTRPNDVLLAPNVPGWDALAIPSSLEAAFPTLAIAIANDVKAATLAEARWGGLAGVTSGVYLNLGTGIAAGIVVGGKVLQGAHGSAGEVGYTLVEGWRTVRLAADGGVPAEEILGGRGIAARASELFDRPIDLRELSELAQINQTASQLLTETWDGISILAANLAITIDPQVLVIGGGYVRSDAARLDGVRSWLERAVPFPPKVLASRFGADASLYGAVALACDAMVARAGSEDGAS